MRNNNNNIELQHCLLSREALPHDSGVVSRIRGLFSGIIISVTNSLSYCVVKY